MPDRSSVVVVLLAILVLLSGCTISFQTTDYSAGPDESGLSTGGPGDGSAWNVTITHVVDGDTVEARFPNGETATLRLLGVDTPETAHDRITPDEYEGVPDTVAGRDHLFEWGERATAFATEELEGETVRIAVDESADRRGGYGRLLVYVYADGKNFNERLLREGYARLYDTPFSLRSEFEAAETEARNDERGLWAFDKTESTLQTAPAVRPGSSQVERVGDPQYRATFAAFVDDTARHLGVGYRD
ncbi:Endonuclease YncB, thermonuclease family [Halanaeroarchaeum sp. HSR-CO]|uniref:thermonuclease family protein n=1 Tax=Halanaeroarchaeum sp. HSR-CO TaxID=2866382 RepID=UPI00217D4A9F|nr:thermonuclease family protein [Halanaeroarchaeum sp. HSR-CO]UWG48669.1 Endonuclease YncB, thermonuclease family [Halanaeroarchaeum sp. HSR-CO]